MVNGERKSDLMSQDLAWAMFDVYLGVDPISKSGKKKLVSRLPGLLADCPRRTISPGPGSNLGPRPPQ